MLEAKAELRCKLLFAVDHLRNLFKKQAAVSSKQLRTTMAAVALTESGATFTKRCKELEIKDDLVQAMATQGVKTLGSFAFSLWLRERPQKTRMSKRLWTN